jgi:hypothetical protein
MVLIVHDRRRRHHYHHHHRYEPPSRRLRDGRKAEVTYEEDAESAIHLNQEFFPGSYGDFDAFQD